MTYGSSQPAERQASTASPASAKSSIVGSPSSMASYVRLTSSANASHSDSPHPSVGRNNSRTGSTFRTGATVAPKRPLPFDEWSWVRAGIAACLGLIVLYAWAGMVADSPDEPTRSSTPEAWTPATSSEPVVTP